MPLKKSVKTTSLSKMIGSGSEAEVEPSAAKAPAKRASRKAAAPPTKAAPAKKPVARGRKAAAKAIAAEEAGEAGDEGEESDTIAVSQKIVGGDVEQLQDEIAGASAPKKAAKKTVTKKSEPVKPKARGRGRKAVEEEPVGEIPEELEEGEDEEEVVPEPTRRGKRAAAKKDEELPAPAPKKRLTKKENDALAAKEKKAEEIKEREAEEIAETQYMPMEVDQDSEKEDELAIEPTSPQPPAKRGAAVKKVPSVAVGKGNGNVAEADEDEDELAEIPAKDPVTKVLRRGKAQKADNEKENEAAWEREKRHSVELMDTEGKRALDRFKKHMDERLSDADRLIASLQEELNAQTELAKEAGAFRKKLAAKEVELKKVQAKVQELNHTIQAHEKENQVLSVKLSAQAQAQRPVVQVPGSAVKPAGPRGGIGAIIGGGEEQWTAKSKMELYSDLTGLDIMAVKREGDHKIFDCLLTGGNGSLHFRLSVLDLVQPPGKSKNHKPPTSSSTDPSSKPNDGEEGPEDFVFIPLLDEHRDKHVIALLPEFLKQEIIFSKENVAGFYQKISSILMKKPTTQAPQSENSEDESGDETEVAEEADETMTDAGDN
ncbi:hypothetical protein RUND412_010197 [Rhizina undulata]